MRVSAQALHETVFGWKAGILYTFQDSIFQVGHYPIPSFHSTKYLRSPMNWNFRTFMEKLVIPVIGYESSVKLEWPFGDWLGVDCPPPFQPACAGLPLATIQWSFTANLAAQSNQYLLPIQLVRYSVWHRKSKPLTLIGQSTFANLSIQFRKRRHYGCLLESIQLYQIKIRTTPICPLFPDINILHQSYHGFEAAIVWFYTSAKRNLWR